MNRSTNLGGGGGVENCDQAVYFSWSSKADSKDRKDHKQVGRFVPLWLPQNSRIAGLAAIEVVSDIYLLGNLCSTSSMENDSERYTKINKRSQNRTVHMVICNTNGPEITQVNKMMVENKLAQYDEEWMTKRKEKTGFRWHHIREDFPTFEMLEKGEYPSLTEVVDLLNKNIDYEKIIDRKMFHRGKMNYHENAPEALRNLPFILLNTNPFRCDIILELHRRLKLV